MLIAQHRTWLLRCTYLMVCNNVHGLMSRVFSVMATVLDKSFEYYEISER